MKNTDFTSTFTSSKSAEEVFDAILNVREWWSGDLQGDTYELNQEFTYEVPDVHFSKQKLIEKTPGQKIIWLVTDSNLSFLQAPAEWTGTKLCFDITTNKNETQVQFTHQGLSPEIECYGACSNAWERIIQESLFSLVTTGKGVKIF